MPFYYKSYDKAAPNGFVAMLRQIYRPLGFRRGYNFPLWIIFGIGAFAFVLSRAMYLNIYGPYASAHITIGDWEDESHGVQHIGIVMHLASVIPAGFLIPWQFLPVIRYKAMVLHRINGYILIILLLFGVASGLIISARGMGGYLDARVGLVALGTGVFFALALAYANIKRLQIDQHRAWMLRAWIWAFTIVTQRLLQLAVVDVIGRYQFYAPMACHTINYILDREIGRHLAPTFYPECTRNSNQIVAVRATITLIPNAQGIPPLQELAAAYQLSFGPTIALAFLLHVFGTEMYLHLTRAEADRLKRVSREKQLARGWSRPGDASWLTPQIWGDMSEFDYAGTEKEIERKDTVDQKHQSGNSEAVV